jgi:hypothetical protein
MVPLHCKLNSYVLTERVRFPNSCQVRYTEMIIGVSKSFDPRKITGLARDMMQQVVEDRIEHIIVSVDFVSMLHYCHSEFISESHFIEIPKQVRNDRFHNIIETIICSE